MWVTCGAKPEYIHDNKEAYIGNGPDALWYFLKTIGTLSIAGFLFHFILYRGKTTVLSGQHLDTNSAIYMHHGMKEAIRTKSGLQKDFQGSSKT
jgi:hypothetical protein